MKVLVTGAYGFIGAHIVAGLRAAGHRVVGCGRDPAYGRRRFPDIEWVAGDFNRDLAPGAWAPRLAGIDALVNAAGILQGGGGDSIDAVHRAAPIALFDACRAAGVGRVIQISALGIAPEAGTAYADTKRAADQHLMSLDLDWVVLRPSLVYAAGSYGGTSLFRGLAGFPFVVPLPGGGRQRFQPIHMADLVRVVCRLIEPRAPARLMLEPVGPEPMTLRQIVLELRCWLGFGPAPVLAVPMPLVRLVGRAGDLVGRLGLGGSVNTTSIRQMAFGSTADPAAFAAAAGFTPRRLGDALAAEPSGVQDRWHARLFFLRPLLRVSLALFWIATGLITVLAAPHGEVAAMLAAAGFGGAALPVALWAGAVTDVTLGTALLLRLRVRLVGAAMIVVTLGYLGALSFGAPALWVEPLGPLVKTLPLMVATLVMMAIEADR